MEKETELKACITASRLEVYNNIRFTFNKYVGVEKMLFFYYFFLPLYQLISIAGYTLATKICFYCVNNYGS